MGCDDVCVGEMKHRITIETPTRSTDGIGGFTSTWATFASAWASITPVAAREDFHASRLEHRVTHKIMIRYVASVTSNMRVVFGSRTFQIKGIKNLEERNRFLELKCEEGVPA